MRARGEAGPEAKAPAGLGSCEPVLSAASPAAPHFGARKRLTSAPGPGRIARGR